MKPDITHLLTAVHKEQRVKYCDRKMKESHSENKHHEQHGVLLLEIQLLLWRIKIYDSLNGSVVGTYFQSRALLAIKTS